MARYAKVYPVPGTCHANWTDADWERVSWVVDAEPDTLDMPDGSHWVSTGRRSPRGELLYRRAVKP